MNSISKGYAPVYPTNTLRAYYTWLCELICVNQPDRSYWLLVKAMYEKKFYWFVPNDDNRMVEGKALFVQFCEENGIPDVGCYPVESKDEDVSMLEMIIGLAYRCENIMVDQACNVPVSDWFWKILSNVGLDKFTDDAYYDLNGPSEIDKILTKINDRTYKRDGKGGLFPLKKADKDQRKVEIWYQMCAYLVENYYVLDLE